MSHTRTARIEDFLKVRCPRCKHYQDRQERYLVGLSVRQVQLAVALALATVIAALSFVTS